jgi:hypothetical protein
MLTPTCAGEEVAALAVNRRPAAAANANALNPLIKILSFAHVCGQLPAIFGIVRSAICPAFNLVINRLAV